mmetsp:Transcript_49518/g.120113  ORF Transcript_49518/g.120113 Transcript_49518/m.120113 type:complete len:201 (-) Transcript_49518:14-616(-)
MLTRCLGRSSILPQLSVATSWSTWIASRDGSRTPRACTAMKLAYPTRRWGALRRSIWRGVRCTLPSAHGTPHHPPPPWVVVGGATCSFQRTWRTRQRPPPGAGLVLLRTRTVRIPQLGGTSLRPRRLLCHTLHPTHTLDTAVLHLAPQRLPQEPPQWAFGGVLGGGTHLIRRMRTRGVCLLPAVSDTGDKSQLLKALTPK